MQRRINTGIPPTQVLVLILFTLLATRSEPFCSTILNNDELLFTVTEGHQVLVTDYINGYNLTYSIPNNTDPRIQLRHRVSQVLALDLGCSPADIVVASVEQLGSSVTWKDRLAVVSSDGQTLCVAMARLDPATKNISLVSKDIINIEGAEVTKCLSVWFEDEQHILIHCVGADNSDLFWLKDLNNNQAVMSSLPADAGSFKSVMWHASVYISASPTALSILKITETGQVAQSNSISAQDLGLDSFNLTDILVSEGSIVINDYLRGIYRFNYDIDSSAVSNLQSYKPMDDSTVKICKVDSRYFVLFEQDLAEVVWREFFTYRNNYQIPFINNPKALKANGQVILVQTDSDVYVYKRGSTPLNNLFLHKAIATPVQILLDPTEAFFLGVTASKIQAYSFGQGLLDISGIDQQIKFTLSATSTDNQQTKVCTSDITVSPCPDLTGLYQSPIAPAPNYTIAATTSLSLPVGLYFNGLNLTYKARNTNSVSYNFHQIDKVPIISIYSKNPILYLQRLDSSNFIKISSNDNSFTTQKCSDKEDQIICAPGFSSYLDPSVPPNSVSMFKIFKNTFYGQLLTYTSSTEPRAIFVQDIYGKQLKKFYIKELSPLFEISDYTLSDQYIFVTHRLVNRINVYKFDNDSYQQVGSITNTILNGGLFRPKSVEVSASHPELIYIKNINSLLLVIFNGAPKLLSAIPTKVQTVKDPWDFAHNYEAVIFLYPEINLIQQYSVFNLKAPKYLKDLPLMDLSLSQPLSFKYSGSLLTVLTTTPSLLVFNTGISAINSILIDIPLSEPPANFLSVFTSQLILAYQLVTNELQFRRIYTQVSLDITTTFKDKNDFVEAFSFNFSVSSVKDTSSIQRDFKVVNYQRELKTKESAKEVYQLPYSSLGKTVDIDDSPWFDGPIVSYSISCEYCNEQFVPTFHFNRILQNQNLATTRQLLKVAANQIWMLTENQTIYITDKDYNLVKPPITDIDASCVHMTYSGDFVYLFCSDDKQQYFLPISLASPTPFALSPILISQDFQITNAMKSVFIKNRLILLDCSMLPDSYGSVKLFRRVAGDSGVTLEPELVIDRVFLNLTDSAQVSGFDLIQALPTLYYVYFSAGTDGIAVCEFEFGADQFDDTFKTQCQTVAIDAEKYQIDGSQILQVAVLGSEVKNYNTTHVSIVHSVIATASQAAHLQLAFKYLQDKSDNYLVLSSYKIVQAFNRYGTQPILNWLAVTPYDGYSANNMFVVAYLNTTKFTLTVAMYPLVTNDSTTTVKQFQNIHGGYTIETTNINSFSGFIDSNSHDTLLYLNRVPNRPNSAAEGDSYPIAFNLTNKISVFMKYEKPSFDKYINFMASNDFNSAVYSFKLAFQEKDKVAWYWIVIGCVGVVLLMVVGCLIFRKWRLNKEKEKKKESLLSEADEEINQRKRSSSIDMDQEQQRKPVRSSIRSTSKEPIKTGQRRN